MEAILTQFRNMVHRVLEVWGLEKIVEILLEYVEYPRLCEVVEKQSPDYLRRTDTKISFSDRPEDEKEFVRSLHQHAR